MFGLFESKSEKLVKKIYKLNRELFSASRNLYKKRNDFWWNYLLGTSDNLEEALHKLYDEKGEEYAENVLLNLQKEQSISFEEQKFMLDKLIQSGRTNSIAKELLISEENSSKLYDEISEEAQKDVQNLNKMMDNKK